MAEFDIDILSIEVSTKADQAAQSIERLAKAFDDFQKRNQGASKSATILKNFNKQAEQMDSPSDSLAKSLLKKGTEVYALTKIGRAMGRTVVDSFNEAIGFTENRNLFSVTMGKYASKAEEYAETVSDALGTNVSDWLRYQGVINDMTKSFGMAENQAYQMSKTLTQLMYDYSSFYNMTVTEAYEKINAGIAGEIEPMRRLGKDLSKAKLEAVALEHGITKDFNSMTQSEKAQLRFIAIMEQSTDVMGDMSRTIDDPANALRVLDARWTAFTRSLGNLFIPIVKNTLPYLQAGAIILKDWADSIAKFFGIEPETVDFESTASNLASASESVSEIKRNLLGIDEINKLGNTEGSSTVGGDLGLDLSQWDYDFIGDANQKAVELAEDLKPVAAALGLVGIALTSAKLIKGGADLIKNFKSLGSSATTLTKALGAGMLAGGIIGTGVAMADAAENGWSFGNALGGIVGVGMGVAGGAMIGGPVGALIGGLASATVGLVTYSNTAIRIRKEAKLAEFFDVEGQAFSEAESYFKSFLDTLQSKEMAEALKVTAEANSVFEEASSNVSNALNGLQLDKDNITLIEDLSNSMEDLGEAAKALNSANIGSVFQSIADALSGNFGTLVEKIGNIPGMLEDLEAAMNKDVEDIQTRWKNLAAEAGEKGWTDELLEKASDIQADYQKLVGMETNTALSNFQTSAAILGNKINAGSSIEEVKENVSSLKDYFAAFESEMTTQMSESASVYDSLINYALNDGHTEWAQMLGQMKTIVLADYNDRLLQGQDSYNNILGKISDAYTSESQSILGALRGWYSKYTEEEVANFAGNAAYDLRKYGVHAFLQNYSYGKYSTDEIKELTNSFTDNAWWNFGAPERQLIGDVDALEDLLVSNLENVLNQQYDYYSEISTETISQTNKAISDMTAVELESLTEVKTIVDLLEEVRDIINSPGGGAVGNVSSDRVVNNNKFTYDAVW